ncbi:MAG TPA: hypothetical protein VKB19_20580, partial [Pedobacter sp.]|nr:hypothetical protein [Pedobacter sp.]
MMYSTRQLTRISAFIIFLSGFGHSLQAQTKNYPPITATKNGIPNPLSPDPIFNYTWSNPKATDDLESYQLKPVSWTTSNPKSFQTADFNNGKPIVVNGEGYIRFDFGQNNAGWVEFDSPDLNGQVEVTISEYNDTPNYPAIYPAKTMRPKKYGNTYRLELNPELYEGVQFAWIHVRSFSKRWHINAVRLVCQTKPVNYRGSFSCSDTTLTRIWYTG